MVVYPAEKCFPLVFLKSLFPIIGLTVVSELCINRASTGFTTSLKQIVNIWITLLAKFLKR